MIEKGIPIPTSARNRGIAAAIRELYAADIGDSVFLTPAPRSLSTSIQQATGRLGWYAARNEDNGTRVWKIR